MTDNSDDLAGLLNELSSVQTELLSLLDRKRERLAGGRPEDIQEFHEEEQLLATRLGKCQEHRQVMLEQAKAQGLPSDSLKSLVQAMPAGERSPLAAQVKDASSRMRLLQHQSLANWVMAQRSLLHLAQLLEIIATGGRMKPTYGNASSALTRGSLMNGEA